MRLNEAHGLAALTLFGCDALRLANGIHETFDKSDGREAFSQSFIDVTEVAADEVMNTGGEDMNSAGHFRQAL